MPRNAHYGLISSGRTRKSGTRPLNASPESGEIMTVDYPPKIDPHGH
jgi:hypothetical protein